MKLYYAIKYYFLKRRLLKEWKAKKVLKYIELGMSEREARAKVVVHKVLFWKIYKKYGTSITR